MQARETDLNNIAVLRGEALRYAATAAGTSMEAALVASRTSTSRETSLQEYFEFGPSNERHRADLDGLSSLLEGLFVENFALRSEVLASHSTGGNISEASHAMALESHSACNVDLSNFIKSETDLSDDDDDGPWANVSRAAGVAKVLEEAAPATPRHSECWADSPRSLPSPSIEYEYGEALSAFDFTS